MRLFCQDVMRVIGVYILYLQNHPVYVGQSTNCMERVKHHFDSKEKHFDSFDIIPSHNRLELEKDYIKKLKPVYNSQVNPDWEGWKKGLKKAKKMGRTGGRPKGMSKEANHKADICVSLYREGKLTVKEIMNAAEIGSKSTLYKYLRARGIEPDGYKPRPY